MYNKPLFSVILLHYNQPNYVIKALDSILMQTYENIELIFADDASTRINVDDLREYVEKNKKSNIKKVTWQINNKNTGTVKSLINAVEKCSGKYLLFFAADDMLFDENVIENFVLNFAKLNDDVYMLSSQCYMMDIDLKEKLSDFVKLSFGISFNHFTALEQYKVFTKGCFLAIGATAMKMDMFKKFGMFNECYKFVEDWSYFLHLTRNGGRIEFCDFVTLLHRDGGVSHYSDTQLVPTHVLEYKLDMLRIFENEIFPFIKAFSHKEKSNLIEWYNRLQVDYSEHGGTEKSIANIYLYKNFPFYYFKKAAFHTFSFSQHNIRLTLEYIKALGVVWCGLLLFLQVDVVPLQINGFVKCLCFVVVPCMIALFVLFIILLFFVWICYKLRYFLKKL